MWCKQWNIVNLGSSEMWDCRGYSFFYIDWWLWKEGKLTSYNFKSIYWPVFILTKTTIMSCKRSAILRLRHLCLRRWKTKCLLPNIQIQVNQFTIQCANKKWCRRGHFLQCNMGKWIFDFKRKGKLQDLKNTASKDMTGPQSLKAIDNSKQSA